MKPWPPQEAEPIRGVAVVVPVLNEAEGIDSLLDQLDHQGFAEIVVVDGGSDDGTAERVSVRPAIRLVRSVRGRGVQLHAGARAASGDALLFLHADTRLPANAAALISAALADPRVAGGAFRAQFDRPGRLLALYSWAGRYESPLTTFGDQAFFVRREAYERAGGFPPWPFLEDVELRSRLKRLGRFVKLRASVTTSARRYQEEGVLRRQLLNLIVLFAFFGGVSPHVLARFYRAARPKSPRHAGDEWALITKKSRSAG